jgi:membrane-associated protease RseP (regulator of RpoE activity)
LIHPSIHALLPTAHAEYDDESGEIVRTLDDPDLIQNRPPLQRAIVISAGVVANVLLSFLICTGVSLSTGIGTGQYHRDG